MGQLVMANQDFELDSQFKMCPFGCSEQHNVYLSMTTGTSTKRTSQFYFRYRLYIVTWHSHLIPLSRPLYLSEGSGNYFLEHQKILLVHYHILESPI